MGTRHIIAVKQDKKLKVANYWQWDGYPSGQWKEILGILRRYNDTPGAWDIFRNNVSMVHKITDKECEIINKTKNWSVKYPWLSRDAWAEILNYIMKGHTWLVYDDFSLIENIWIEWSYIIDLDTNTLEIYKWAIYNSHNKKRKAIAKHKFNNLPTLEEWADLYNKY